MTNPPPTESLSETEREILRLLATGATNREIARARGISEATVKKHVTNINAKLGTGNRTEAMRRALELGLVSVEVPDSEGNLEEDRAADRAADRASSEALSVELARAHRHTRTSSGATWSACATSCRRARHASRCPCRARWAPSGWT